MSTLILGVESSCDETAAAVIHVEENGQIELRSNVVSSQVKLHARYGGVVPELASRAHLNNGIPVLQQALEDAGVEGKDLDLIAVTKGPGLIGALLVGLQMAKSLAYTWDCPLVGVNHHDGHLKSVYLEEGPAPQFPFVALLVSGGHTSLYRVDSHSQISLLGATRDDAAGEAFDKGAKMLGLPYPGGIQIDTLSQTGDPKAFHFPRAMMNKGLDLSFSGLKTACRNMIEKLGGVPSGQQLADFCASYQEAIVDALWKKTAKALKQEGLSELIVSGGVAANSRLRERFTQESEALGYKVHLPSRAFCTDNAAMIATAGYFQYQQGERSDMYLNANNRLRIESPTT
ncbi:MAG TPA: tRNA (adenosine(37)-N6)-threonylcarbamoyltransferase complex transferase subunit TsaD [Myxococcales bacterium]|nr:tRNA (adenosine(37)-N6)-threonylcarbamoyltransferase complex transferase subunit TsaD [Deltaproteobacteria bacterium]HAA55997.1 tRNA (adenosine(37)-N6)-threonylcarbamoyltransferase complex transferase subunit TsaD [Myxococcales bacterium]|tara:strand:+ start:10711 stop:11745 length:1035 start_codon:yes stop_codon:yes gene_type:complete